jgi:hypothetical protein
MTVLLCFLIYFQKTVIVDVALEAKDDGDIASESLKRTWLSLLLLLLLLL